MKTKTINLYKYHELSPEAKKYAHNEYIKDNDYYFLSDYLNERLHVLLVENKIKDTNDTSKPNTKPTPVLYSLSNSQGDGCMFEGVFEWNGYTVKIKHVGRHCHSNCKDIEITDEEGNEYTFKKVYDEFEVIYQKICKELEKQGYEFIDFENSEEAFAEACEANDWTFQENGVMENLK